MKLLFAGHRVQLTGDGRKDLLSLSVYMYRSALSSRLLFAVLEVQLKGD